MSYVNSNKILTVISASNLFLPIQVDSSPYNIEIDGSIWGDWIKTGIEGWDDGNTKNGDGCSSTCSIETGWTWSGGSSTSKDTWNGIWGDGRRVNSNSGIWDDGNNVSGDGWDSAWYTEVGWTCTGGSLTNKDTCSEICGDGIRFHSSSTYWDDGNTKNGDGCSSTCSIETGWTWSGGSSTSKDTWKEICGDGIRYNSNSSYWDDGNTNNGDGCTSSWSIESGWIWKGGSNSSVDIVFYTKFWS